jgi:hypothetical protein
MLSSSMFFVYNSQVSSSTTRRDNEEFEFTKLERENKTNRHKSKTRFLKLLFSIVLFIHSHHFTWYFQYRFLYLRLERLPQNSGTVKFFVNVRHVWEHILNITFCLDTFLFPFVMSGISGTISSRDITLCLFIHFGVFILLSLVAGSEKDFL